MIELSRAAAWQPASLGVRALAVQQENRGLALIGYRGTGKSTVGRIVASRLDRTFLDADREIEARAGRSIRAGGRRRGSARSPLPRP